jgi:hypothetical protein
MRRFHQTLSILSSQTPFAIDFKAKRLNYNVGSNVMEGYVEVPAYEYAGIHLYVVKEAYRVLTNSGSSFFPGWNRLQDILTGSTVRLFT